MTNPLINILIRTSNRPEGFKRLIDSIKSQSYKNVNIIVSYDTLEKPSYIEGFHVVKCFLLKLFKHEEAWYNRYCNVLLNYVRDGYFIFIDDDDFINPHPRLLELIVRRLNSSKANIIQMTRKGRKKPVKDEIVCGKIGMPCIILHSDFKDLASFDGSIEADYKYIKEVSSKLGYKFIPIALVESPSRSYGK